MEPVQKEDRVLMTVIFSMAAFLFMLLYDLLDFLSFQGTIPLTLPSLAWTAILTVNRLIALTGLMTALYRLCGMKRGIGFLTALFIGIAYSIVNVMIFNSVHAAEIHTRALDLFTQYESQLGGQSPESMLETFKPLYTTMSYVIQPILLAAVAGISYPIARLLTRAASRPETPAET
jgi:hypothetical protein